MSALGLNHVEVGAPEGSRLTLEAVVDGINRGFTERGINPKNDSDAADLSRDLVIDEAVAPLGGRWTITDDYTLRVWPRDMGNTWPFKETT